MDEFLVRPYADGDHIALAALVTALGYPSTADQLAERMRRIAAHPDHATFMAERRSEVVGMVGAIIGLAYEHDAPVCRITGLAVAESARRQSVGRLLMARAEVWARERGAGQVSLTSHLRRGDAHAFYRSLGYEETGRRFVRRLPGQADRSGRSPER
jgi:GNAT superfamily N-acetyltransferase